MLEAVDNGLNQNLRLRTGDQDGWIDREGERHKLGLTEDILEGKARDSEIENGLTSPNLFRGKEAGSVEVEIYTGEAEGMTEKELGIDVWGGTTSIGEQGNSLLEKIVDEHRQR
jgi:hypothetical protein